MMMLLILTSVLGYELKTAVGTSVFIMTFTALTGAVSHFMIGGAPDWGVWMLCVLFTLLWARIAAVFANKATPKTLNRATGVVLVVLGIVIMGFKLPGIKRKLLSERQLEKTACASAQAVLVFTDLLFLDGGALDHPVGSAADGLGALQQRGCWYLARDLLHGLFGALGTLRQIILSISSSVGTRFSCCAICSRAMRARVFFSAPACTLGGKALAGLVDLAQIAVQGHALHLQLLLHVLHLLLVGALHQNAGQLALSGGGQLGQHLILGVVQCTAVTAVVQLLAHLSRGTLPWCPRLPTFLAKSLFMEGSWRTHTSCSLILNTTALPARSFAW